MWVSLVLEFSASQTKNSLTLRSTRFKDRVCWRNLCSFRLPPQVLQKNCLVERPWAAGRWNRDYQGPCTDESMKCIFHAMCSWRWDAIKHCVKPLRKRVGPSYDRWPLPGPRGCATRCDAESCVHTTGQPALDCTPQIEFWPFWNEVFWIPRKGSMAACMSLWNNDGVWVCRLCTIFSLCENWGLYLATWSFSSFSP